MIIDTHCHLDFPDFKNELNDIVHRAKNSGVSGMVTISTNLSRVPLLFDITSKYNNVWCTVGVHPHEAESHLNTEINDLVDLAQSNKKVIGIGETGLDYYYENSPLKAQQKLFRAHISASSLTGLPLIIHTRNAEEDTIKILKEEWEKSPFTGLIHCFTASEEFANEALDLGLYISISGIITFKNSEKLRETVKKIPLERILLETDSPYLAPVPNRGKRNEPSFVVNTANELSKLYDINIDALSKKTTQNFFNLFTKAKKN